MGAAIAFTQRPRDIFQAHYRAADVLLRVHQLLVSDDGPHREHALIPGLRSAIASRDDEDLILLLNRLFVGVVRETADMSPTFFRQDTLDLLLRQSIVAACSALDIAMPLLLKTHLGEFVRVRQRNFLPTDGTVKALFADFRLGLVDVYPLADEEDRQGRWDWITQKLLDFLSKKTLSNVDGVTASLALLGVEKAWEQIGGRTGEREQVLREKLKTIVTRRNDIVHRADRPSADPGGSAKPIDYNWTQNHVGAIRTIVLACCDLAGESVAALRADSAGAPVE